MSKNKAKIIVVSNCKGGSGKTTIAIHLIISLLEMGYKVASFDLDYQQQSLTRYINNRKETAKKINKDLYIPVHSIIKESVENSASLAQEENIANIEAAIEGVINQYDYIVFDTPGSLTDFAQSVCSYADIIITPISDSFMDFDLLGHANAEDFSKSAIGIYAEMLWEQKKLKAQRNRQEIKWFVVRNRLAILDTINNRNIEKALTALSKKIGFKVLPGFADRVVFKELFLHGLTLHDAINTPLVRVTPSTLAARQELFDFVLGVGIESSGENQKIG